MSGLEGDIRPKLPEIPISGDAIQKDIPLSGLSTIESEVGGRTHLLKARFVPAQGSDTLAILLHGAAAPNRQDPNRSADPLLDAVFYQAKLQESGIASFAYNSVGVGSTPETTSSEGYDLFSIANRIQEADNVVRHLIEDEHVPQRSIVLIGVSTGAHVAVRALNALSERAARNENYAQDFLDRISSIVFIGGGAFMPDVEDMSPYSPPGTPEEETRTYRLRHTNPDNLPQADVFSYLLQLQAAGTLPPILTIYGELDKVIPPQVQRAYRMVSGEFHLIPGQEHLLLSRKVPDSTRGIIAKRIIHFIS